MGELCNESFDGVHAPALPNGWGATNPIPGNGIGWVTTTTTPATPPNAAFIDDQAGTSDKALDSKAMFIGSVAEQIFFLNKFDTELGRDGGVLEVSSPNINGGTFTDLTDPAVGGSFEFGGYTAQINGTAQNPLAGRMAWTGNSAGYINTGVNLGPSVSGQVIKLRFRMGTDEAGAALGWFVDGIYQMNCANRCRHRYRQRRLLYPRPPLRVRRPLQHPRLLPHQLPPPRQGHRRSTSRRECMLGPAIMLASAASSSREPLGSRCCPRRWTHLSAIRYSQSPG